MSIAVQTEDIGYLGSSDSGWHHRGVCYVRAIVADYLGEQRNGVAGLAYTCAMNGL